MTDSLLRQRRNLFIVCTILWAMKYGGAKFSVISMAGVDITFSRPEAFAVALWIAFGYFLYRYYLYFLPEGIDKIQVELINALNASTAKAILEVVRAAHPNFNGAIHYAFTQLRQLDWKFRGDEVVKGENEGPLQLAEFEMRVPVEKLWVARATAYWNFLFRTSATTDYLLPFVYAFFILWYCGQDGWYGSPFQILFGD